MANYTMAVRTICEYFAGLEKSAGSGRVDFITELAWPHIFTTSAVVGSPAFHKEICMAILKAYYMREIAGETFGLWQLWMNQRLEEIEPYYSQLYSSLSLSFDPYETVDITETGDDERSYGSWGSDSSNSSSEKDDSSSTSSETSNTATSRTGRVYNDENISSDTPQGALSDIQNGKYATNADFKQGGSTDDVSSSGKDNASSSSQSHGTSSDNSTLKTQRNDTEDKHNVLKRKGFEGNKSEMLIKYRETFLNIKRQIIDEFADLFMMIY